MTKRCGNEFPYITVFRSLVVNETAKFYWLIYVMSPAACIGYCIVLNFEQSGEKFNICNNRFVAITL